MPTSEARIQANQQNALKSSGPKTPEGKAASRQNSLKHGMTGAGVILGEGDAAEVEQLARDIHDDLKPPGETGALLARTMAVMAVRMERASRRDFAANAERVRRTRQEFVPPEGVDDATAAMLREEAATIAWFDPGPEASRARRYEAAAERNFFRAYSELRRMKKEAHALVETFDEPIYSSPAASAAREAVAANARARQSLARLGSFSPAEPKPAKPQPKPAPVPPSDHRIAAEPFLLGDFPGFERGVDVPISIGRPR